MTLEERDSVKRAKEMQLMLKIKKKTERIKEIISPYKLLIEVVGETTAVCCWRLLFTASIDGDETMAACCLLIILASS